MRNVQRKQPAEKVKIRPYTPPEGGKPIKTRNRDGESITATIEHLMNIYADSLEKFQKEFSIRDARLNAGRVWRAELPELTDLQSVLTFIALIAWGLRLRILETAEAKTMMFMAQTQLTALSKAEDRQPGKRRILPKNK